MSLGSRCRAFMGCSVLIGQGGTCPIEFSMGPAHEGLMALCRAQLGLIWRGQSLRRLKRDQLGRLG